jgi:hypothetical protein
MVAPSPLLGRLKREMLVKRAAVYESLVAEQKHFHFHSHLPPAGLLR